MRRYIESALRLRVRLLICGALVFVLASVALFFAKQGYTSVATVWVEKSIYIPDQSNLNQYISPAQNQANVLNELLGTWQFGLTVAQSANIPMRTDTEEGRTVSDIQRNLWVEASGAHLIKLNYTGSKPDYCQQIISQTIKVFIAEINANRINQAQAALKFYREKLAAYDRELGKSREALNKYLQENPGAGRFDAAPDPTYVDLQQKFGEDRTRYSELAAKIDEIEAQSNVTPELNNTFFRVIDQPKAAEPYKITTKDLLRNAIMALVMAMIALVGLTLVGTWTDGSVYTLNDISSIAPADDNGNARELLVGMVPYVRSLAAIRQRTTKRAKEKRTSERLVVSG